VQQASRFSSKSHLLALVQAGASQSDAKKKRSLPTQTNTLHGIFAMKTPARTELKIASRPTLNESGGGKSKHSPIDLTDSDC
jgi:hypothetical protein